MPNLADLIEEFILRKLSDHGGGIVLLQRNDLADELACAPSQISYVLSTRFTSERGFYVESRRGSGGFIRIARIPAGHVLQFEVRRQEPGPARPEDVVEIIGRLRDNGMVSAREAVLLTGVFEIFGQALDERQKIEVLRSLLGRLMNL
ncbi:CtsR family transcriptional regulator [Acetonema longum]|uniref:Transcriptional regulator CtsR n=1 Tax=Acetonema longum DSM 6540 TaxID=1009370 RepID=F7NM71_9FIRM|nr:CtsR family transcriptional regulator [Acetonema longum]EGO62872.1 transcriptional regulator CtsR [Acetonema longum DSM 6540]